MAHRDHMTDGLLWLGLGLTLLAAVALAVVPTYSIQTGNGRETSRTIYSEEGATGLVLTLAPIAAAAAGVAAGLKARRSMLGICLFILAIFCLVAGATIGLFFLPGLFLLGGAWLRLD